MCNVYGFSLHTTIRGSFGFVPSRLDDCMSVIKTVMASSIRKVIILLVISVGIFSESLASSNYAKAVIESCRGCSLNRLPDVKKFIFEDVPHYDRVEFKPIQGAIPELVLYDRNDEIVERLQLSRLTREECNELLASKGFPRDTKPAKDEI